MECFASLAMTVLERGANKLRANRFDVVAVGVDQEGGEIARAVIGPRAGGAVVTASGLHAFGVKFLDCRMIGCAELDMGPVPAKTLVQINPERRLALGPEPPPAVVPRTQHPPSRPPPPP